MSPQFLTNELEHHLIGAMKETKYSQCSFVKNGSRVLGVVFIRDHDDEGLDESASKIKAIEKFIGGFTQVAMRLCPKEMRSDLLDLYIKKMKRMANECDDDLLEKFPELDDDIKKQTKHFKFNMDVEHGDLNPEEKRKVDALVEEFKAKLNKTLSGKE